MSCVRWVFQARAALLKSLKRNASLEQRVRVEVLLEELKKREINPELNELRDLRAIEILEVIGTPAAWSVLESLATGAPGMRLTDEAAAALGRRDCNASIRSR